MREADGRHGVLDRGALHLGQPHDLDEGDHSQRRADQGRAHGRRVGVAVVVLIGQPVQPVLDGQEELLVLHGLGESNIA